MKHKLLFTLTLVFLGFSLQAQELKKEVFELLNLTLPGLETVKEAVKSEDYNKAAENLLIYYRNRQNVKHPEVNLKRVRISEEEQKWADDGLKHVFFVHSGYQPSYFYGEDINWEYWPVQDNELRWQLHRHKWWTPMGKAYRVSGDEKYAKEWTLQYLDWIRKNPLIKVSAAERKNLSAAELKKLENVRYAWRPLEVSNRLQDQTNQFMLFKDSKFFTPAFLTEFLTNYYQHAEHIIGNYSDQGNHLLFEAQRMLYAGALFPEFKKAAEWRKSGIDVLNREIGQQVFEDGFQYELDPHYHLAAINIFIKGLEVASANGFRSDFPPAYLTTVEKMIVALVNISFPDYSNPCFSDAKRVDRDEMVKNYKRWQQVFPANPTIEYLATEGKSGKMPDYLSSRLANSGFYSFRNGWNNQSTTMILKAGPPAFWHNQPDNGTFELMINGRNFFPDAGSYVYAGSAEVNRERDWFRQTMVHKTLTLNNANLENTDSKCLLWETNSRLDKLVVENQSYSKLTHRRTVFFVDQTYFVIVDEAIGEATGDVAVHYQLAEGDVNTENEKRSVQTLFDDGNNLLIKGFAAQDMQLIKEEGWVSYAYRQKKERPAFAFKSIKSDATPLRFITVITPVNGNFPSVEARFVSHEVEPNAVKVALKINKKKYTLHANW